MVAGCVGMNGVIHNIGQEREPVNNQRLSSAIIARWPTNVAAIMVEVMNMFIGTVAAWLPRQIKMTGDNDFIPVSARGVQSAA